jgi:DNA (cytosine-5)-methyltransferase 1
MYDNNHIPWDITKERREDYAASSRASQAARREAELRAATNAASTLTIAYDPNADMPQQEDNGFRSLSLFSGGGGLDLGFDRAGYSHVASYEVLPFAGDTLRENRRDWRVFSGPEGDVVREKWHAYAGKVDVIHGGPPCQPFSIAGRRAGEHDARDMFPEFSRAVEEIKPKVFVAENVLGFLSKKFDDYRAGVLKRLSKNYDIEVFTLSSADFGVPQDRRRVFIVGAHKSIDRKFDPSLIKKIETRRGVREALGLPILEEDGFAPTLRCTLTGPRQTTSIANSTASVVKWTKLGIWPHGVSPNRSIADAFPTKNQTYRLCVEECQILQGFPLDWTFTGAVYQRLGMIGNSVCPPVAYAVAHSVQNQLLME